MSIMPNYVPRNYKTINVILTVKNAQKALEFYNSAFGAEIVMRLQDPNGTIIHAEMKIADTVIMVTEEDENKRSPKTLGGTPITLQIYVGDAEGFFEDAVNAGAEVLLPIKKKFYGDRVGLVRDPFGHQWMIATHMEDVPARELEQRFHDLY